MKLIIPKEIEERIHGYVMSVNSEIAGMGKVRVEGDDIIVEEVMIYEQSVTGATADLSPQAMAKWQTELVRSGGSPKNWKLWWHSHHTMNAFFSGRDTDTIDAQTEGDWLCSLVVNCKREREARLDTYKPFRMYMDKLDIQIGTDNAPAYTVPADILAEVAEKVKRPVYTAPIKSPIGYHLNTVDLHRYCPMFTTGETLCYYPNGKDEDCTTQAFKKKHGANPFMDDVYTGDYTRDQLITITETLKGQIREYENHGRGDSEECLALSTELIDMYYELAEAETEPEISAQTRKQAQDLEATVYQMEQYD